MRKNHLLCNKKGLTVLEIVIVSAVIGLALVSLLGLASFSLSQSSIMNQTAQATALAREQLEVARSFRDGTSWSSGLGLLTTGVDYYPSLSGNNPPAWQMLSGAESVGIFIRSLVFTDALRDGSGNIVESGGTADEDTKKVVSAVSWTERGRAHQVELVTYLANWK